jgi:hypothetical protein
MSEQLIIRGKAKLDIAEASLWYAQKRQGLGDEFLAAVRARLDRVVRETGGISDCRPKAYQTCAGRSISLRDILCSHGRRGRSACGVPYEPGSSTPAETPNLKERGIALETMTSEIHDPYPFKCSQ